jgi:hypothetical protein
MVGTCNGTYIKWKEKVCQHGWQVNTEVKFEQYRSLYFLVDTNVLMIGIQVGWNTKFGMNLTLFILCMILDSHSIVANDSSLVGRDLVSLLE